MFFFFSIYHWKTQTYVAMTMVTYLTGERNRKLWENNTNGQ